MNLRKIRRNERRFLLPGLDSGEIKGNPRAVDDAKRRMLFIDHVENLSGHSRGTRRFRRALLSGQVKILESGRLAVDRPRPRHHKLKAPKKQKFVPIITKRQKKTHTLGTHAKAATKGMRGQKEAKKAKQPKPPAQKTADMRSGVQKAFSKN